MNHQSSRPLPKPADLVDVAAAIAERFPARAASAASTTSAASAASAVSAAAAVEKFCTFIEDHPSLRTGLWDSSRDSSRLREVRQPPLRDATMAAVVATAADLEGWLLSRLGSRRRATEANAPLGSCRATAAAPAAAPAANALPAAVARKQPRRLPRLHSAAVAAAVAAAATAAAASTAASAAGRRHPRRPRQQPCASTAASPQSSRPLNHGRESRRALQRAG
jgi:hypothetical protein